MGVPVSAGTVSASFTASVTLSPTILASPLASDLEVSQPAFPPHGHTHGCNSGQGTPGGSDVATIVYLSRLTRAFLAVVDELVRMHSLGVILKAIRPSAILFDPFCGIAQMLDFSQATLLAKENAQLSWVGAPASTGSAMLRVPLHQQHWMAPEESGRSARAVDVRTDVYQAGMTFYTMLVGSPAFASAGGNTMDPMHQQHQQQNQPSQQTFSGIGSSTPPVTVATPSPSPLPLSSQSLIEPSPQDVMALIHAHLARPVAFPRCLGTDAVRFELDNEDRECAKRQGVSEEVLLQNASHAYVVLKKIILVCLSKMVEERYSSANGLKADLMYVRSILRGSPIQPQFRVTSLDRHAVFVFPRSSTAARYSKRDC